MYEELNETLSRQMAEAYLARIGINTALPMDKTGLDSLIAAHQLSVPFEDIDSHDARLDIELATQKLFDKIVTRRRGGYCFELNALFCKLLKALGFNSRACLARVIFGGRNPPPPLLHRVTLVDLGGALYFCDVGFGGPMPLSALPLAPGDCRDAAGKVFRFEERAPGGWYLFSGPEEAKAPLLCFSPAAQLEVDFITPNFYCSHAPDSYFVSNRIVSMRAIDGSAQLFDNHFKFTKNKFTKSGKTVIEKTARSAAELAGILGDCFGIVVSPDFLSFKKE
jgi:N-hydroxyarylamine O-acetyltransferase